MKRKPKALKSNMRQYRLSDNPNRTGPAIGFEDRDAPGACWIWFQWCGGALWVDKCGEIVLGPNQRRALMRFLSNRPTPRRPRKGKRTTDTKGRER